MICENCKDCLNYKPKHTYEFGKNNFCYIDKDSWYKGIIIKTRKENGQEFMITYSDLPKVIEHLQHIYINKERN